MLTRQQHIIATYCVSITKIPRLILLTATGTSCSENHMTLTDTFCAQNSQSFNFKITGGPTQAYNNYRVLNNSQKNPSVGSQKKLTLNCRSNHIFQV